MPKKKNKTTEAYAAPTESLKNVEEQSIVTENVTALESKVEEPKVEESKVEEPKVEEPKVEEPKVEEPKVEEPKVEEAVVEEAVVEEPTLEEPSVKSDKYLDNKLKEVLEYLNNYVKKYRDVKNAKIYLDKLEKELNLLDNNTLETTTSGIKLNTLFVSVKKIGHIKDLYLLVVSFN